MRKSLFFNKASISFCKFFSTFFFRQRSLSKNIFSSLFLILAKNMLFFGSHITNSLKFAVFLGESLVSFIREKVEDEDGEHLESEEENIMRHKNKKKFILLFSFLKSFGKYFCLEKINSFSFYLVCLILFSSFFLFSLGLKNVS